MKGKLGRGSDLEVKPQYGLNFRGFITCFNLPYKADASLVIVQSLLVLLLAVTATWRTQSDAAVFQQVTKMLKHGLLVLTTDATEVAQESTAACHHLRESDVLERKVDKAVKYVNYQSVPILPALPTRTVQWRYQGDKQLTVALLLTWERISF